MKEEFTEEMLACHMRYMIKRVNEELPERDQSETWLHMYMGLLRELIAAANRGEGAAEFCEDLFEDSWVQAYENGDE